MILDFRSDEIARWVKKRVHHTENSISSLKYSLSDYVRNQDRLRKKSLRVAESLKNFADYETPNVKNTLEQLAYAIETLEQHRKLMQDRIDVRSLQPLELYRVICQGVKDELKIRESALSKETKKLNALEKAAVKTRNSRTRVVQSQIELAGANQELMHTNIALADNVESFESRKISDLKEFFYSQIAYHAKSLEILTQAQSMLTSSTMEDDLEEIRDRIKVHSNSYDD